MREGVYKFRLTWKPLAYLVFAGGDCISNALPNLLIFGDLYAVGECH
jgi:hypothetical protein